MKRIYDRDHLFQVLEESLNEIYIFDAETFRFVYANKGALKNIGYSLEQMRKLRPLDIKPEYDATSFNELVEPLRRGEKSSITFETLHQRSDGTRYYVEVHLQLVQDVSSPLFVAMILDISERREAEQEREQLFHVLDESLNEIYMFDMETLRFLYVNRGALKNIGYTQEQMESMTPLDIKPEFDEAVFQRLIAPLRDGKEKITFETSLQRADGSRYHAEVHLQRFSYLKTPRFVAIILDITDRKAAENQILQLNNSLEEKVKERTQQLESFAYSVSHDLRAPLRAINGYSQILLDEYRDDLDSEGRRIMNAVIKNATRMGELIDDLLEFSRLDRKHIKRRKLQPEQLVKAVVTNMMDENTQKVSIDIQPMPDMSADYSLMYQVYQNLISNALKFSTENTRPRIEIGSSGSNGEVVYYVKDNGVGFNMDYYDKLFGVFQRLHSDKEFEGTGVGLAIVERIIQRHGGRVWADSEISQGSTFYFTLD